MKEVARAATPARTELEIAHFELVASVARVARGSHLRRGENSSSDSLRRSFSEHGTAILFRRAMPNTRYQSLKTVRIGAPINQNCEDCRELADFQVGIL